MALQRSQAHSRCGPTKSISAAAAERAIADNTEAIRLKPDFAGAYNLRGAARRDKGDLDGALKDLDEAIRLKPDHVDAYYNRATVRERQSARSAAVADYQKYLDLGGGMRDGDQAVVEAKIRKLQQAK